MEIICLLITLVLALLIIFSGRKSDRLFWQQVEQMQENHTKRRIEGMEEVLKATQPLIDEYIKKMQDIKSKENENPRRN